MMGRMMEERFRCVNFIVCIVHLCAGAAAVFCVVVMISSLRLSWILPSPLSMLTSLMPSSQNHSNACCCSHARRVASHMFSSQSSIVRAQWELLQVSKKRAQTRNTLDALVFHLPHRSTSLKCATRCRCCITSCTISTASLKSSQKARERALSR